MSRLSRKLSIVAGLLLAGGSHQARANYGVAYGCAPCAAPAYAYAPAYPAFVPAPVPVLVPVYAPPPPPPCCRPRHRHFHTGLQIRTPGFSLGLFR